MRAHARHGWPADGRSDSPLAGEPWRALIGPFDGSSAARQGPTRRRNAAARDRNAAGRARNAAVWRGNAEAQRPPDENSPPTPSVPLGDDGHKDGSARSRSAAITRADGGNPGFPEISRPGADGGLVDDELSTRDGCSSRCGERESWI